MAEKEAKNAVHDLENWRIRIRQEEGCADKWEDWWGWMVKEEDRAKDSKELQGNTKSLINAKEVPAPNFASSEFLKAHYGSMLPEDKFHTPQLVSHNYGWAGRKTLEPPALRSNFGRVNARLETNDPR